MADQGEAENYLPEPGFGDGQPEEELGRVGRERLEGLVEGLMGAVELLVDKLAADLLLVSSRSDRLAGQRVERELLACLRGQGACGASRGKDSGGRVR